MNTTPQNEPAVRKGPWPVAVIALLLLSVLVLVAFFAYPTFPNYDSYYSLLWAREVLDFKAPVFDTYRAPTEHPLAILYSMVLAPLGRGADRVMLFCAMASFVAIAMGAYTLAKAVFNRWVGLLAGLLSVLNFDLTFLAVRGYIDVTYIALILWAAVIEVKEIREDKILRRGWLPMLLLVLAGMLRPEAWVLSGLYALWIAWQGTIRDTINWQTVAWIAAGCSSALIWCAVDFAVTGDPMFSLHHTSTSAEDLKRTRGWKELPFATAAFMSALISTPMLIAGLTGAVGAFVAIPKRILVVLALLLSGTGTFFLLGLAGFSVIDRYLIVPAVLMLLFAAFAFLGWTMLPNGRLRTVWMVAAIVAGVTAGTLAGLKASPAGTIADLQFRGQAHKDLETLLDDPKVKGQLRCGPLWMPNHKLVPDARWIADLSASQVLPRSLVRWKAKKLEEAALEGKKAEIGSSPDKLAVDAAVDSAGNPLNGVAIVPTNRLTLLRHAVVDLMADNPADAVPPPGFSRAAVTKSYAAYARC